MANIEAVADEEAALSEADEAPVEAIAGKSPTRIALGRLARDKVAVVCGSISAFIILCALCAPLITKYWPWGSLSTEANHPYQFIDPATGLPNIGPPDHGFIASHPLGINPSTAADNLAWILYGLRTDLGIAFAAVILLTIIGTVLGLVSGFSRGAADRVITFITDTFLCFPFLLGALAVAPIITGHFRSNESLLMWAQVFSLIFVLTVFGWMMLCRLIRGYVITLREREFIQSAEVIGVPKRRILFKELLPNMVAPLVVTFSMTLPTLIEAAAGLAFLGLGVTTAPSLGVMISSSYSYYSSYPVYVFAPILVLLIFVLCLNLLGDSVRDAFDPKTRR